MDHATFHKGTDMILAIKRQDIGCFIYLHIHQILTLLRKNVPKLKVLEDLTLDILKSMPLYHLSVEID